MANIECIDTRTEVVIHTTEGAAMDVSAIWALCMMLYYHYDIYCHLNRLFSSIIAFFLMLYLFFDFHPSSSSISPFRTFFFPFFCLFSIKSSHPLLWCCCVSSVCGTCFPSPSSDNHLHLHFCQNTYTLHQHTSSHPSLLRLSLPFYILLHS